MPLLSVQGAPGYRGSKARRISMKGSVQPMRISEFEPMVFALAKMEPKRPPRYGAQKSKAINLTVEAKKELDKTLPRKETGVRAHAAAKRGRAAIIARRLAKKPNLEELQSQEGPLLDMDVFNQWALQVFKPKRF